MAAVTSRSGGSPGKRFGIRPVTQEVEHHTTAGWLHAITVRANVVSMTHALIAVLARGSFPYSLSFREGILGPERDKVLHSWEV